MITTDNTDSIAGYFSLSIKPIIIKSDNLSNRSLNKILRMSDFDEEKLISMYQNKGFKSFNIRRSRSGEDRKLIQMYRLI